MSDATFINRTSDQEVRRLDYIPVELPQPRSRLSRIVRVAAHMRGVVSRGEHDDVCAQLFDHYDGRQVHHQDLIGLAGLAYEGLTGLRPIVGCLKCDRSDIAVLSIAVAFRGGGGFCASRSIRLKDPETDSEGLK